MAAEIYRPKSTNGKSETGLTNVGIGSRIRAAFSRENDVSARSALLNTTLEGVTLFCFTAFFLFYGLVPIFGGAVLGLVGADEPRYAQVAREMLARNDFITPILYGQPWLEKPALYYWRAMFAFREFGIHDWSARLPSASFAFTLIVLIYLHMRRFRAGGQLDAAIITASCAGIIAFARGASTDMQLAAPFCIGMLGWYAWYETDSKFWLFDLYFFVGAATLAKGPIAPFMAIAIILSFAALRREWSILRRSIWIPGVILYFAMVLPWFIAVQRRNPNFLRIFFLEHNLQRFATDLYKHEQAAWYYVPTMLLGLTPWAVIAGAALVDAIRESFAEWRARRVKIRYIGHSRAGDAFPEFLLLWALFPIIFFSFSKSKLPGYVLPSIPPLTILAGDYLNRKREQGLRPWLLIFHAISTGVLTAVVLLLPRYLLHPDALPARNAMIAAGMTGFAAALLILVVVARFGLKRLRIATIIPIMVLLLFLLGVGPVFGVGPMPGSKAIAQLLDQTYSARPLARVLLPLLEPGEVLAVYRVRRDVEYGLSFYRNKEVYNYEQDGTLSIPAERHILVVRESYAQDLRQLLHGRSYEPLFTYPAQNLVIYSVSARVK
ncbi:Melittin resistance protein PqaB [Acidisarcina polymorpha]|uniref:Melittin resistance protein PqaB n=1 Tax=Acidisarcina polymorpha TaxID=2211140 RepID=A0A2Z5G0T0_9BACT|nr:glycosyltransferase family 39 protein [Acidisarcina polymorpha]AXC12761.1 Melittin resistance protein PqaB [Acidisarcina polymorpha]